MLALLLKLIFPVEYIVIRDLLGNESKDAYIAVRLNILTALTTCLTYECRYAGLKVCYAPFPVYITTVPKGSKVMSLLELASVGCAYLHKHCTLKILRVTLG